MQDEQEGEPGDKSTGSGRAGYGKWEVVFPPPPLVKSKFQTELL